MNAESAPTAARGGVWARLPGVGSRPLTSVKAGNRYQHPDTSLVGDLERAGSPGTVPTSAVILLWWPSPATRRPEAWRSSPVAIRCLSAVVMVATASDHTACCAVYGLSRPDSTSVRAMAHHDPAWGGHIVGDDLSRSWTLNWSVFQAAKVACRNSERVTTPAVSTAADRSHAICGADLRSWGIRARRVARPAAASVGHVEGRRRPRHAMQTYLVGAVWHRCGGISCWVGVEVLMRLGLCSRVTVPCVGSSGARSPSPWRVQADGSRRVERTVCSPRSGFRVLWS